MRMHNNPLLFSFGSLARLSHFILIALAVSMIYGWQIASTGVYGSIPPLLVNLGLSLIRL